MMGLGISGPRSMLETWSDGKKEGGSREARLGTVSVTDPHERKEQEQEQGGIGV